MAFLVSRSVFNSKIALRTLILFVLCALIPIIFLSIQSSWHVNDLYQDQLEKELRSSAKGMGLLIFERLQYVERQIGETKQVVDEMDESVKAAYLLSIQTSLFNRVHLFNADDGTNAIEKILGSQSGVVEMKEQLRDTDHSLMIAKDFFPNTEIWFVDLIIIGDEEVIVGYEISGDYIWEYLDEYDMSRFFNIYNENNQQIYSSHGLNLLEENVDPYLGAERKSWLLFLDGVYGAGSWRIESIVNSSVHLSDENEFKLQTLMSTLLAVLVAGLIGAYSIRKSTAPIEKLRVGIEHINNNDFQHSVDIKSNDEFEILGNTFNTMTKRLGRHILALSSLSVIDRLILDRLKIEDIVAVVLSEGSRLLQAKNIYFLVRNDGGSGYTVFSLSEVNNNTTQLSPEMLLSLHKPDQISTWNELNLNLDFVPVANHQSSIYSSTLMQGEEVKAVMIVEFIAEPEDDLVRFASLFVGHVTVALTNADWEERLFKQAHYDTLTGLPNRYYFNEQLVKAVEQATNSEQKISLYFINIDKFKSISGSLRRNVVDAIIKEMARRLDECVGNEGILARLAGVGFVLICINESKNREKLITKTGFFADKLRSAARKKIILEEREFQCVINIGIALFPYDSQKPEDLLRYAELAMNAAKNDEVHSVHYFSAVDNSRVVKQEEFLAELHRALAEHEFELYYQPKVNLKSGMMDGCEALIRWNHPERGLLSPFFFIPQAEELGMIGDIGRWVNKEAARQQVEWIKQGYRLGRVAINVSVLQLIHEDFYQEFLDVLNETGCPGSALEIEITETAYVEDMKNFHAHIENLNKIGITFSVDDYGTGYSSLSLLLNLPVTKLKIDKSFVDEIETSTSSYAIIESTILLANKMGLTVVAEGVETFSQLSMLKCFNCDSIQGYYFSRPVPAAELIQMAKKDYFHTALMPERRHEERSTHSGHGNDDAQKDYNSLPR